ncbi:hypothetical protein X732_30950 [Mesorhizobium sp. L2C066B000]|nr:hypothetical protein X732_30950 [Mesorhizobium sp. L2C066B000]
MKSSAVDVDAQSWECTDEFPAGELAIGSAPDQWRETLDEKAPEAQAGWTTVAFGERAFEDEIECKMDELDTRIAQSLRSRLVRGARASELLVDRAD